MGNKVEIGAADKLPYVRVGVAVPTTGTGIGGGATSGGRTACTVPTGQSKDYGTEGSVGVSTKKIIAATRGEDAWSSTTDYSKKTPIGCIGPNVFFGDIAIPTGGSGQLASMVYSFCDPTGMKGVARSEYNINQNLYLYAAAAGTTSTQAPATNTYFQTVSGVASSATTAKPTTGFTKATCGVIQHVWDPVMAAQLTEGAFCCNAEYYGPDGVGRAKPYYQSGDTGAATGKAIALPTGVVDPKGTGDIAAFNPPLTGGDMSAESSPGDMCPAHGSGNGYTQKTYGSILIAPTESTSPTPPMKELLEGQAFYAALAPSQYSLPTTSTTTATQTANAKKQNNWVPCYLLLPIIRLPKPVLLVLLVLLRQRQSSTTVTLRSISRFGRLPSVQGPLRQSTLCPTDTATPTPASTTSLRSARNPHSREPRSLVSSSLGPTWLRLRMLQLRVAMPTLPAPLLPPPGTVVRP